MGRRHWLERQYTLKLSQMIDELQCMNRKLAILAYPQLSMFELGCALELFALKRPEFEQWYQTEVVSLTDEKLETIANIQLQVDVVNSLTKYGTLIIPGWSTKSRKIDSVIANSIKQFYNQGGRIVSLCSGAFLLAELGLLDGKRVTTHWRYAELFQQRFPQVEYVENVLYTVSDNIGCSAGSAAALDLGLEIIRQDFGAEIGSQVAKRLVVAPHRQGGQAQFVDTRPVINQQGFSATLDWALLHLDKKIDIDDLSKKALMSRRTFDRQFRATLNQSPKQWLTQQRLQKAQNYLECEDLSIDRISEMSGFENAMNLRHYFRKYLGVTPTHYKQQFKL